MKTTSSSLKQSRCYNMFHQIDETLLNRVWLELESLEHDLVLAIRWLISDHLWNEDLNK